MYFVAFDNDQNQNIDDDYDDFEEEEEDNTPRTEIATGEVAVPHDDLTAYKPKTAKVSNARKYRPRAKAKGYGKGAKQLGAPWGHFENPCLSFETGGCSRTAMDDFYRALDDVYQKRPGSRAAAIAWVTRSSPQIISPILSASAYNKNLAMRDLGFYLSTDWVKSLGDALAQV